MTGSLVLVSGDGLHSRSRSNRRPQTMPTTRTRRTTFTDFTVWRQEVCDILERDFRLNLFDLPRIDLSAAYERGISPEKFVTEDLKQGICLVQGSKWVDELRPGYFAKK